MEADRITEVPEQVPDCLLYTSVVAIKRVSKTVKGGRTMRFSALVVVGDGNGHVGAGLGKAGEVPEAIRKGKEAAMKNLVEVPVDDNKSIPHDLSLIHISSCYAQVTMQM